MAIFTFSLCVPHLPLFLRPTHFGRVVGQSDQYGTSCKGKCRVRGKIHHSCCLEFLFLLPMDQIILSLHLLLILHITSPLLGLPYHQWSYIWESDQPQFLFYFVPKMKSENGAGLVAWQPLPYMLTRKQSETRCEVTTKYFRLQSLCVIKGLPSIDIVTTCSGGVSSPFPSTRPCHCHLWKGQLGD